MVVLLLGMAATSRADSSFYNSLMLRGMNDIQRGEYAHAVGVLKIAAFGFVSDATAYLKVEVYLAVAYERLGRHDDASLAVQKAMQAERIRAQYASLAIDPDTRTTFEKIALKSLRPEQLALVPSFTRTRTTPPPAPQVASVAPMERRPEVVTPAPAPAVTSQSSAPIVSNPPAPIVVASPAPVTPQPVARPAAQSPAPITSQPLAPVAAPKQQAPTKDRSVPVVVLPPISAAVSRPAPQQAPPPPQPAVKPKPQQPAPAAPTPSRPVITAPKTQQPVVTPAQRTISVDPQAQPSDSPLVAAAKHAPSQSPMISDAPMQVGQAQRMLNEGKILAARQIYLRLAQMDGLTRTTLLDVAKGLNLTSAYRESSAEYQKALPFRAGEEMHAFYEAVNRYEMGDLATARDLLQRAQASLPVTRETSLYKAKILGMP
jgi:hypothetical protein